LSRWRIHAGSPPSTREPGVKTTERIRIASTNAPNGILHAAIRIWRVRRRESCSEKVSASSGKASASRHCYHLFFTEVLLLFLLCSLGFDTQAVGLSRNVSKPTQPKVQRLLREPRVENEEVLKDGLLLPRNRLPRRTHCPSLSFPDRKYFSASSASPITPGII